MTTDTDENKLTAEPTEVLPPCTYDESNYDEAVYGSDDTPPEQPVDSVEVSGP